MLKRIDNPILVQVAIGATARLVVVLVAVATVVTSAWALVDHEKIHVAVGFAALMITLLPFLFLRKYDLFSPWSFVILAIFTGGTLQGIAISAEWPSAEHIDTTMLLGQRSEYFFYPAFVYLSSLACLALGYFIPFRLVRERFWFHREFALSKLRIAILLALAMSLSATALYIRATGGFASGRISDKRTTITSVDVANDELEQYGYLRQITKLGALSFLVLGSFHLSKRRKLKLGTFLLLTIVFALAILMPFYASSRAGVVWLFIGSIGLVYYYKKEQVVRSIPILLGIAVVIFVAMSMLRHTDAADAVQKASMEDSFKSLLLNRNGPNLAKTAHIINHLPGKLEFQYGRTIAVWALAPIPRAIFPGKPLIHSGPIIGTEIYGTKVSGVPPGLIAEMYWNFHLAGAILGLFLTGVGLRWIYEQFWRLNSDSAVLIPMYLFSLQEIGYGVLGHSLGFGVFMKFIDFLTAAGLMYFCTRKIRG